MRMKGVFLSLLLLATYTEANPKKLFKVGLKNYEKGRYAEALDAFQQAQEELPESPEILYNLALTQYQSGQPELAAWSFQQAAGLTHDTTLRARCFYNAANCYASLSTSLQEKDLSAALNQLQPAIQFYHIALETDPQYTEAAINLERTLNRAISLRKQIKKKQEEEQKKKGQKPDSSSKESDEEDDNQQMQDEASMDESGLFEDADPFGDFSEYEEIHGLPPPNESESSILDQEIRQQEQRKKSRAGRYKSVEKDW